MTPYLLWRFALIIPTLLGIITLNFIIIQAAPGGPVEQAIAQLRGHGASTTAFIDSGGSENLSLSQNQNAPRSIGEHHGIDDETVKKIEQLYGFDKSPSERFFLMLYNYLHFDFGESFHHGQKVLTLILDKLPVSISLGFWTLLLTYLISIPLGIKKAMRDGSHFDLWTSSLITIGYAIPAFLFAILLIVLFAGGSFFNIFPLRGLVSDGWETFTWYDKILDYLWHITLPVVSMVIGSFASLTMLTKNAFLDEIRKAYVRTAFAKGLSEKRVLYGHVFRNGMLIVIAGFPAAFISVLLTGSLLTEIIFSLDGLGLLGFEAVLRRDYPVLFGTLYIYTLIGLLLKIVSDLTYTLIDPRIDFARR